MPNQPIPEELREAVYHLSKGGKLVFSTLPIHDPNGTLFKATWPFVSLIDPMDRLKMLKEAYRLGAKDSEIIRIVGETGLDLDIPNALTQIGLKGVRIQRTVRVKN